MLYRNKSRSVEHATVATQYDGEICLLSNTRIIGCFKSTNAGRFGTRVLKQDTASSLQQETTEGIDGNSTLAAVISTDQRDGMK